VGEKVCYQGKIWDSDDLPTEAKQRLIDMDDRVWDRYILNKSIQTYEQLLHEQNGGVYWSQGKSAKARNEYWRGCSEGMNSERKRVANNRPGERQVS